MLANINSGTSYSYDPNGNTTLDGLRGAAMSYNVLNLPDTISKASDRIIYIYSAAGEKLAKKLTNNQYRYYAGSMVYKDDKTLSYIIFEEGLVNKGTQSYDYEYHLRDHLGNTRVTFEPEGSGTATTQVAEYYPFGSSYIPISPTGTNKYLYNGKEKQDDILDGTNLDLYDYGARFYDPHIGRFHSQDTFSEKYYTLSPYQYAANNPIKFIDVNGDSIWVSSGGQRYYYGYTEKTGYGMYDKSGQLYIGNDKALNSVNGALARLSLGKEGKALVSDLMSSTTNNTEIAVRNGADNSTEPTKGSYVIWDPNNTTGGPDQNGNTTRESFLGLGHELAHVQDIWAGTVDHNIWVTVQKPNGTYKNIENNDIYATHIENKLRTENGVLLRAAYLPTPAGAVDLNGNPIPSTRIIRAGTSESIFYQQNGTTNYLPLKKGQTPYKY